MDDYSSILIQIKQETAQYWKAVLKGDFDSATEHALAMQSLSIQLMMTTKEMK
jgi:hypothetical protein